MKTDLSKSTVNTIITGKDLRIMRIYAELTTSQMAEKLNVKSRKTIENWEQQNSQPSINVFLYYCVSAGFDPAKTIAAVTQRNAKDPTQKKYFDMDASIDTEQYCCNRITNMKMPIFCHFHSWRPKG